MRYEARWKLHVCKLFKERENKQMHEIYFKTVDFSEAIARREIDVVAW